MAEFTFIYKLRAFRYTCKIVFFCTFNLHLQKKKKIRLVFNLWLYKQIISSWCLQSRNLTLSSVEFPWTPSVQVMQISWWTNPTGYCHIVVRASVAWCSLRNVVFPSVSFLPLCNWGNTVDTTYFPAVSLHALTSVSSSLIADWNYDCTRDTYAEILPYARFCGQQAFSTDRILFHILRIWTASLWSGCICKHKGKQQIK